MLGALHQSFEFVAHVGSISHRPSCATTPLLMALFTRRLLGSGAWYAWVSMDTHSPEIRDVSRPVATSHDDEPCTVSVPEASELFATAALPRTERAIQRFCKKGELKCAFVETPFGSKYLIARSSIDRLIVQKKQAQKFAPVATVRDLPRPDATDRDQSRREPETTSGHEEPGSREPQVDPQKIGSDTSGNQHPRQGTTSEPDTRDL